MPNGRLTRQTSPRLARGLAVLLATLAASAAGCQRFPLRYAEVTPESTSRPTTEVESAKADPNPPGEIAPLDATPLSEPPKTDESAATEPTPVQPGPKPAAPPSGKSQSSETPLIDQALKRAEAVSEPIEAAPEPADAEPKPADAPVDLPSEPAGATKDDPNPAGPVNAGPVAAEPAVKDTVEIKASIPREFESPGAAPAPGPDTLEVRARSEPKPIDPEKPGDEWRDGLKRVHELALQRAGEPGDAAQAWAIRARVLDWLAGEGPEPAGETGRVWNSVLATLSTATGPETPDASTLAYHLGAAVEALESYAPIQITALNFCHKIDGFGHYDPVEAPEVRPGQPLLVYCEMSGLRYEENADGFRSRLSSQVEVIPAGGGDVVWSEALGTAEDLCRRRRRDYFVNYRIVVPARLAPGSYSLRLSQTDLVSNRSISAAVPFSVTP